VAFSPAGEGLGESQFRRLEKSLALCLLCELHAFMRRALNALLYVERKTNTKKVKLILLDIICQYLKKRFNLFAESFLSDKISKQYVKGI
jgi:hypothetical protein